MFRFFFFFLMIRRPPRSTLFPTRRSSDLSARGWERSRNFRRLLQFLSILTVTCAREIGAREEHRHRGIRKRTLGSKETDRKSTRLNSSHSQISYAVFCLKKKKKSTYIIRTVSSNWRAFSRRSHHASPQSHDCPITHDGRVGAGAAIHSSSRTSYVLEVES